MIKRTLTKEEHENLHQIFKMREEELLSVMTNILRLSYSEDNIKAKPQYVYAAGDLPILLVAHLDTVHALTPSDIYFDTKYNVMWSPQGLGADDRAGVFSIFKLIQKGYKPHVLFTTGEETGGTGARLAAWEISSIDVKFIIELDRKGNNDSVFYDCDNEKFETYINLAYTEKAKNSSNGKINEMV
jgi:acetylornithine deacetylase/succinyl-diaminopimelate desuccinylase-like protein